MLVLFNYIIGPTPMVHWLLAFALLQVPASDWRFDDQPDGAAHFSGDRSSGRFGATGNVRLGAAYPELGEGPAFFQPG